MHDITLLRGFVHYWKRRRERNGLLRSGYFEV